MRKQIRFTLNGKLESLVLDRERMLLWVLCTDFGLTGTT
jgi:aerobic-type carbon monoxide dehydrogenase small subunit (CoxS/CutS family)